MQFYCVNLSVGKMTTHMPSAKDAKLYILQVNEPKMFINHLEKMRFGKISQIFHQKVALAIFTHDLSFSFIEYKRVRNVT